MFDSFALLKISSEQGGTNDWSSILSALGQFFFLIVVFILIIVIAIYTIRFTSSGFRKLSGGSDNIRVLETRALGANTFIHLVKAGDKYIVVSSAKDSVSMLVEVSAESISDSYDENTHNSFSRKFNLKDFMRQKPPKE